MKNFRTVLLSLGLMVTAGNASGEELACRGSLTMPMVTGLWASGNQIYGRIWLTFQKGKIAALSGHLQPGECSWTHRAMEETDSAELFLLPALNNNFFTTRGTLGEPGTMPTPTSTGLPVTDALRNSGQYVIFKVEIDADNKRWVEQRDAEWTTLPLSEAF